MRKQVLGLCVLLLSNSLIGCGSGGSPPPAPPPPRRVPELPAYDKTTCKVQPYDGDAALHSNLGLRDVKTERVFNKAYNRPDLEAVSQSSAVNTSFYVMDMGVRAFKIPREMANTCPIYYVLEDAPKELRQEWDRIAGMAGGGTLAGLYFEYCPTQNCDPRAMNNATILVLENSDRWTLVHEMMHHNFNRERKADPNIKVLPQLRRDLELGIRDLENLRNAYRAAENQVYLMRIAERLDAMVDDVQQLLVSTVFEEIALESLLLDEFFAGRLKFVDQDSVKSAAWYMDYARKEGMRQFDGLGETFKFVVREASKPERPWPAVIDVVERSQAKIRSLDKKTTEIVEQAHERVTREIGPVPTNGTQARIEKSIRGWGTHIRSLPGYEHLEEFNDRMDDLDALMR